jgi:diadenosine tetraphosphate (Ap4A) HIT family hydrolase
VTAPRSWMPLERWEALVRGEGCPLCAEVRAGRTDPQFGYGVAELDHSYLRLAANQYVPGYSVLICKTHVREPYELPRAERSRYFDDLMRAAQALERVFRPIKMNYEILGNAVPHLHCHLVPRYHGDPAPGTPIDTDAEMIALAPQEYERRIEAIREALHELGNADA